MALNDIIGATGIGAMEPFICIFTPFPSSKGAGHLCRTSSEPKVHNSANWCKKKKKNLVESQRENEKWHLCFLISTVADGVNGLAQGVCKSANRVKQTLESCFNDKVNFGVALLQVISDLVSVKLCICLL